MLFAFSDGVLESLHLKEMLQETGGKGTTHQCGGKPKKIHCTQV